MHELIEALAGLSPDGLRDQGASRLIVQTGKGTVSIYTAFADWLRDRHELINGIEMRDLLSSPDRERVSLFRYFAAYQVAYEEMNNVTY
jgi:hypothetical protein